MKKIITIVLLGLIVVSGVTIFIADINYDNREIELRNQADKKLGEIETVYDQMWKILSQKAGVTKEYRNSFDSIYTHIISGRYSQGDGSLMKWITESNPKFDASLYKDLMNSIEIERNGFSQTQKQMLDIIREHKNLLEKAPSRWFINDGLLPIDYTVISSSKSKSVLETSIDDDIQLF
jgi:hypothetical protein